MHLSGVHCTDLTLQTFFAKTIQHLILILFKQKSEDRADLSMLTRVRQTLSIRALHLLHLNLLVIHQIDSANDHCSFSSYSPFLSGTQICHPCTQLYTHITKSSFIHASFRHLVATSASTNGRTPHITKSSLQIHCKEFIHPKFFSTLVSFSSSYKSFNL